MLGPCRSSCEVLSVARQRPGVTSTSSHAGGEMPVGPARLMDTREDKCGPVLGPGEARNLTVVGQGRLTLENVVRCRSR